MGYLEYVEEMEYSSRVRFIVGKDALYRFRALPADYELLVNALLRNYSGLFSDYVFIDERYLSRITKLSRHRMYEIFVSMSNQGLVSYAPSKKSPIITFTRHRVLGSELRFPREVYDERKAIFGERLKWVINYAASEDKCRSRMLLEYFGEKGSEECRRCDVCVSKRAAGLVAPSVSSTAAIMQLLSDGKPHSLDELSGLGLTEAETKRLLRQLCDEEQINIIDGKIMKLL
jgi:ATP-dependent DNA helicase RecQ